MRVSEPSRTAQVAIAMLLSAVLAGCGGGPIAVQKAAPVAVADIEVLTNPATNPEPGFIATCQIGAKVRLKSHGSHDPNGGAITCRWRDTVDGVLTEFVTVSNPFETPDPETVVELWEIGANDIELTVTASNGRKATTTLRVFVTPCEECGG